MPEHPDRKLIGCRDGSAFSLARSCSPSSALQRSPGGARVVPLNDRCTFFNPEEEEDDADSDIEVEKTPKVVPLVLASGVLGSPEVTEAVIP